MACIWVDLPSCENASAGPMLALIEMCMYLMRRSALRTGLTRKTKPNRSSSPPTVQQLATMSVSKGGQAACLLALCLTVSERPYNGGGDHTEQLPIPPEQGKRARCSHCDSLRMPSTAGFASRLVFFTAGDLLQIADEWAALAKDDDVPDELDPDLQQSINEVHPPSYGM